MSGRATRLVATLAAFAVTFGSPVWARTASAQTQGGYRQGELREHHGPHRFGSRCFHRVSAEGVAQLDVFGGPAGSRKAQARAIQHWSEQVAIRFGGHLARWDAARGREVGCRSSGPADVEMVCLASGHPCH